VGISIVSVAAVVLVIVNVPVAVAAFVSPATVWLNPFKLNVGVFVPDCPMLKGAAGGSALAMPMRSSPVEMPVVSQLLPAALI
jgi:hypothetical protein